MVLVREAVMADWQAWRDIRLLAQRAAPDAFSSTYAEQVKLGEAYWRQRVSGGGLFLAWIPEASPPKPAPSSRPGWPAATRRRPARSSSFPCSSGRRPAAAASARR